MNRYPMRMVNIAIVSMIVFILLIPINTSYGKSKPVKPQQKKSVEPFIEKPFNPNVDNLPPKFVGHSYVTIYFQLQKNKAAFNKSEYETEDTFETRLESIKKQPLIGDLRYDGIYAFAVRNAEMTYDADKGILNISKHTSGIEDSDLSQELKVTLPAGKGQYTYIKDERTAKAIELFSYLTKKEQLTGQNAFGVKAKITRKTFTTYSIAFRNIYQFVDLDSEIPNIKVALSPNEAKDAKVNGCLLFICNLARPYVGFGVSRSSATIDDPIELNDAIGYISVEPHEIWFYNYRTGHVYLKEKIEKEDILKKIKRGKVDIWGRGNEAIDKPSK